jgi:hypothetical protein
MRDFRRTDHTLAWTQDRSPSSHADAEHPRDDLEPFLLKGMDVLVNVRAWWCEILEPQRPVSGIPARLEYMEPVPEEAELVSDERALHYPSNLDPVADSIVSNGFSVPPWDSGGAVSLGLSEPLAGLPRFPRSTL